MREINWFERLSRFLFCNACVLCIFCLFVCLLSARGKYTLQKSSTFWIKESLTSGYQKKIFIMWYVVIFFPLFISFFFLFFLQLMNIWFLHLNLGPASELGMRMFKECILDSLCSLGCSGISFFLIIYGTCSL